MCRHCGLAISVERLRRKAVFCSKECRAQSERDEWKKRNPRALSARKGNTGAAHELLVSADLLMKGFEVFRALSPDCPCDLAIIKGGKLLKVQVTTGYRSLNGAIAWPYKDPSRHDVLAVVVHGEIHYTPNDF